MPVAPHDASRARPGLHGLDRTVTPRWLREHRRGQARASRDVAADIDRLACWARRGPSAVIGAILDTDVFSAIIEERPQAEKCTSVLLGIDTARFPVGS